ncbi:MAG: restriction endonuclease subunit S [Methylophilus sp.]|nr:restriction endonuclease subunit S [Methylophilus sp.]
MKAGWEVKTLGEVCEVVNGGTPKTGVDEYWGNEHLWITPAEMGKRLSPYVDETERKITSQGLKNSSARLLPPNSVILSSRAPIGHLVVNTKPMATNQGCKGLVPSDELSYKYLFYFLMANVDLLNDLGTGATFKELSGGKLKEVKIPLAPSTEQQRIVAILEQAFEGIAKARANAEQNLQNARALFESHLQSVFSVRGEPVEPHHPSTSSGRTGWVEKDLGSISKINYGYTESASYEKVGPNFLRITDIQDTGVNWETVPFCKINSEDLLKYLLETGDIVFARTGATTGKSYLVKNPPQAVFASYLIRVQLKLSELLPEFLYLFFQTKAYWDEVNKGLSGSAQGGFNASKLANLIIPYPLSIEEQRTIITELDAIKKETQRLEIIYQRKIACLDELKKSLLQQAFAGEL